MSVSVLSASSSLFVDNGLQTKASRANFVCPTVANERLASLQVWVEQPGRTASRTQSALFLTELDDQFMRPYVKRLAACKD